MRGIVRFALALILGCNDDKSPAPPIAGPSTQPAAMAPAEEARQIEQNRCANCHGTSGRGDGPSAATLNPKPRDFTSKDWQKSVTDAQLKTVIIKGGGGAGKSVLMPSNPDLEARPEVVTGLVQILRSYGK